MGVLDKLLLPVNGVPLIQRTVLSVLGEVDHVVVVVSIGRAAEITDLLKNQALVVVNPRPTDGMGSSIAAGLRSIPDAAGYLLLPGDMPLVKSETVAMLVERFRAAPARITLPVRDGRRGHPVIFPAWAKFELNTLKGDNGGGTVIDANPHRLSNVDVGDTGIWRDIDRPDDYHALVSSL
jgi:molybdenum cofactor cytidylyltransferase